MMNNSVDYFNEYQALQKKQAEEARRFREMEQELKRYADFLLPPFHPVLDVN
jgi:predicted nuclease with RNAse H fold